MLVVVVHCAGIQDCHGAKLVMMRLGRRFPRLRLIWADAGYPGAVEWALKFGGWVMEIIKRKEGTKGFEVLPRRWVVERTFAWLSKYRRLSKDYEEHAKTSEAWVQVAMIHIMVRRLAHAT